MVLQLAARMDFTMRIGHSLVVIALGVAVVSCRRDFPDRRSGPKSQSFVQICELPESVPPGVVLEAARTVNPYGEWSEQRGQVTDATGTCDPRAPECGRVDPELLRDVYLHVKRISGPGFRSKNEASSPHYGFRTLAVIWKGGRCAFVDGVTDPLEEGDRERFMEAYDAIAALVVKSRTP
jgi:hypothetical protein